MGFHGNARNCIGIHEIQCVSMGFFRIPWNSMDFCLIPWNSMEFGPIPWNSIEFRPIPWNSREFQGISCKSMEFHGIPCNLRRRCHIISCIHSHVRITIPTISEQEEGGDINRPIHSSFSAFSPNNCSHFCHNFLPLFDTFPIYPHIVLQFA